MSYGSKGGQNWSRVGPQLSGEWRVDPHLETWHVVLEVTKTRLDIIFGVYTSECAPKTTQIFFE